MRSKCFKDYETRGAIIVIAINSMNEFTFLKLIITKKKYTIERAPETSCTRTVPKVKYQIKRGENDEFNHFHTI